MDLADFFLLSDSNVRSVVLGSMILGASSAVVGTFSFLRKRALAGDAVAHSILPGICLSFLLIGKKDPLLLMAGGMVTGWLSLLFIDGIVRKSKLKADTAIGIILSVFFGAGILLLTAIQHQGNASQSGLDKFIFGKAASMTISDVTVFSITAMVLLIVVLIFFKEFKLIAFNIEFARTIGIPVKFLEFLLATITILAVTTGIQAVGVVLMASLLITPAAAARFWTDSFKKMIVMSAGFGAFAALAGTFISYTMPNMPTGPWIVVTLTVIAVVSLIFAPGRGVIFRLRRKKRNSRKIAEENILKVFYQLGEKEGNFAGARTSAEILVKRDFDTTQLTSGIKRLERKKLVKRSGDLFSLTNQGINEGMRVTRLHRLWELYLSRKLRLDTDHIHSGAEAMEHIITPEIEAQLEKELGFPEKDPHDSPIPFRK